MRICTRIFLRSETRGFVFTIDRRLEIGGWLDYGMFLKNIMVTAARARARHLHAGGLLALHRALRHALPIPETEIVVRGMSRGYPDMEDAVNTLVAERIAARDFPTCLGWPDEDRPAARRIIFRR